MSKLLNAIDKLDGLSWIKKKHHHVVTSIIKPFCFHFLFKSLFVQSVTEIIIIHYSKVSFKHGIYQSNRGI